MTAPVEPASPGAPAASRRARAVRTIAALALVAAILALTLGTEGRETLRQFLDRVPALGPWGPALFIAAYLVATVLFLPGSLLTLGAGAVFGVVWGSVWVSIGSTAGATAAFLVGRHLAREAVLRRVAAHPGFHALDEAVGREGWKIVLLARLSPVIPFNLLNYALGLTRIRLAHYVLASWIGMMPATVLYVYLGSLLRSGALDRGRSPWEWALQIGGLAATAAVTVLLARLARRALRAPEATAPGSHSSHPPAR